MSEPLCKRCHTNPVHPNLVEYQQCAECWEGDEGAEERAEVQRGRDAADYGPGLSRQEMGNMKDADRRYVFGPN